MQKTASQIADVVLRKLAAFPYSEALKRMASGTTLGGVIGGIKGLSSSNEMGNVGRLAGIGALGGLGINAARHGFEASDPDPLPVRAGVGGLLGGGVGLGIPYLLGVKDPSALKRFAAMGAIGGAGVGTLGALVNPRKKPEDKEEEE